MPRRPTVTSLLTTIRTELTANQRARLLAELLPDFVALCQQEGLDVVIGEEGTVIPVETADDFDRLIDALPEGVQVECGTRYLARNRAAIDQQYEEAAADKAGLVREVISRLTPDVRAALRKKGPDDPAVVRDVLRRHDAGESFGQIGMVVYRMSRDWAEKMYNRWKDRRHELDGPS
jgi:hypothetical protein